jgi:hypothetical protein
MAALAFITGIILIVATLWEGFETIILPRRVTRTFRLTRLFYQMTWVPWSAIARRTHFGDKRDDLLSYFGPLSLLILLAIWALGIIFGYGLIQWAIGSRISSLSGMGNFEKDLYLSFSAFFTVGFGDVTPNSGISRFLTLVEGGNGLGFLALIIGYLPALNNAFSNREVNVSLLDERAGSPPTAVELLRRFREIDGPLGVDQFLRDWERWSAELMESHLSYPVLAYFRSQHENQSWLGALTMVLDLSALVLTGVDGIPTENAQLAFAMARHAAADLAQVFNTPPVPPQPERLSQTDLARLRAILSNAGLNLNSDPEAECKLTKLRSMYEPYINSLSRHLLLAIPPWLPIEGQQDNWETTAWEIE